MELIRNLKGTSGGSYWMGIKRLRSQHGRLISSVIITFIIFTMYMLLGNSRYRKKNISSVYGLSDYHIEDSQSASRLHPPQILFWTSMYRNEGHGLRVFCMKTEQLQNCPYKCDFTRNRSYFETADAVVFDCRSLSLKRNVSTSLVDVRVDFPEFRMQQQYWVFLMFEAPCHTFVNLKPFEDLFNWTMTYRRDSDVYIPYGRLISREPEKTGIVDSLPQNTTNPMIHGRKLAAWVVSNCNTPGGRKKFADELIKYMPIDIYGSCGPLKCTPPTGICENPLTCHKAIGPKYKFYLAFENSLCVDYITEKFYNALRFGMVPVVFGYGDYAKVAPESSYIDARSFESPKKLAEYLLFLDSHPEEYLKYFEWKKLYMVHEVLYFEDAWCSLCKKLWKMPVDTTYGQSPSARNLTHWWYHSSKNQSSEPACLHPM